jgi:hypothetical protein
MKETRYYNVAGHVLKVTAPAEDFALMTNYEPFAVDAVEAVVRLTVTDGEPVAFAEELRQDEEGQEIVCGKTAAGEPVFQFCWWQQTAGYLVCAPDYREARLVVTGSQRKMAIDNALMVLYALATASRGTVLFHAAVVSCQDRAYMFLGKSGTGKSTHARLWLRYISGTELVNDDNPVVRCLADGSVVVYGSPWSGKTPCYRNLDVPVGAIVDLHQAKKNVIKQQSLPEAYASIYVSFSGYRFVKSMADGYHATNAKIVTSVPCYSLDCLPNPEAAFL